MTDAHVTLCIQAAATPPAAGTPASQAGHQDAASPGGSRSPGLSPASKHARALVAIIDELGSDACLEKFGQVVSCPKLANPVEHALCSLQPTWLHAHSYSAWAWHHCHQGGNAQGSRLIHRCDPTREGMQSAWAFAVVLSGEFVSSPAKVAYTVPECVLKTAASCPVWKLNYPLQTVLLSVRTLLRNRACANFHRLVDWHDFWMACIFQASWALSVSLRQTCGSRQRQQ